MEPNGKVVITFSDGVKSTYMFSEIVTWKAFGQWVMVFWKDHSVRWPIHQIIGIEVWPNSDEYVKSRLLRVPQDYLVCPGCDTVVGVANG